MQLIDQLLKDQACAVQQQCTCAPGNMWRLRSFQQVFVQEEAEGIGIWCKTTQTLRYAMSHALCKTMDSGESEHTNT